MGKGIKEVANEIGLDPIVCQCGRKIQTTDAIYELFEYIIKACREGESVRIKNFGLFYARLYKGRTLNAPVLKNPNMVVGDSWTLRFRQSSKGKVLLNKQDKKKKKKP